MAKTIIKLEKEDIVTNKLGINIVVHCENGLDIIFSEEAIQELINDYHNLISE